MKKVAILLILFLLTLSGCSSIVNYSIKDINIYNYDNASVKKWVESNSKTDGVYLGKINNNEDVMYYLYVNYSFKEVSIDSGGKDSIIINTNTKETDKKRAIAHRFAKQTLVLA